MAQKNYIWAKPTKDGFEYYTHTENGWEPLSYPSLLDELKKELDPDGDGNVNSSEPLSAEEIQSIYNKVYTN